MVNEKSNTAETLADSSVRVEKLIYLGGALSDIECPPEDFTNWAEWFLESERADHLIRALPELKRIKESEGFDDESLHYELAYALYNKPGFLVQLARPVMQWYSDTHSSYSWGYYSTAWFYLKNISDLEALALAYSDDCAYKEKQNGFVS